MTLEEQKRETPVVRILLWVFVFVVMLLFRGPALVHAFSAPDHIINDFFQDWAAARYHLEGTSPYADQEEAVVRYLGRTVPRDEGSLFNTVNAHPPTSILLFLPLAALPYPEACRLWAFFWLCTLPLSFYLIVRGLRLELPWWSFFPIGAGWLLCNPLMEEIYLGQFNLLLLLGITLAWLADRNERPVVAGILLGTVTAIKLFPAFLFLPFLVRGRWGVLWGGVLSFLVLTGATMAVLGPQVYLDYFQQAMPAVANHRDSWLNVSLHGYFARLFDSPRGKAEPLFDNPMLAKIGIGVGVLLVVAGCLWTAWKAKDRGGADHALSLCLTGMLLICPLTWTHYFLLLVMPVLLLWRDLPQGLARIVYFLCLILLLFPHFVWIRLATGAKPDDWNLRTALPWQSLTALGVLTYVLVVLFLLGLWGAAVHGDRAEQGGPESEPGRDA